MIVPDLIALVDFEKSSNEFIFILENYILHPQF